MGTAILRAYDALTWLLAPLIQRRDAQRLTLQGDFQSRLPERQGHSRIARPEGRLVWIHAVSVGEAMTALPLIDRLLAEPDVQVLLTTTTGSSAQVVAPRLPQRAIHQFAPLDLPAAVATFLDHWQPDLALFVESELWPRQIRALHRRAIPTALVNARLSERSVKRWSALPRTAKALLAPMAGIWAQTPALADALCALAGSRARVHLAGNLKAAAAPLPSQSADKAALADAITGRPVWLAASTHPGEEELAFAAHRSLLARYPTALLILAPRHVERAEQITALIPDLCCASRSSDALPAPGTQVYLADTLGEMGLWYDLVKPVFLGGSLVPVGGHNPLEPASFACSILCGPHVQSAALTMNAMAADNALRFVKDDSLAPVIADFWDHPETCAKQGAAAQRYVRTQSSAARHVLDDIAALLPEFPS